MSRIANTCHAIMTNPGALLASMRHVAAHCAKCNEECKVMKKNPAPPLCQRCRNSAKQAARRAKDKLVNPDKAGSAE